MVPSRAAPISDTISVSGPDKHKLMYRISDTTLLADTDTTRHQRETERCAHMSHPLLSAPHTYTHTHSHSLSHTHTRTQRPTFCLPSGLSAALARLSHPQRPENTRSHRTKVLAKQHSSAQSVCSMVLCYGRKLTMLAHQ